MGKALSPRVQKQLATNPEFWNAERRILLEILFPFLSESVLTAALNSYELLAAVADLGIAWDLINPAAIAWAEKYTVEVVGKITQTSMAAFLDHFEPWVASGDPLSALVDALTPFYGPVRGQMVAVTETTRAFHSGNVFTWKTTGMVEGWRFNTVRDERVCPICAPLDGQVFPLNDIDHAPPRHVLCRCFSSPVVSL